MFLYCGDLASPQYYFIYRSVKPIHHGVWVGSSPTHYIRSLGSVKGFSDNRKLIGSSKCMIEEIQDSINNIWKYRLRDKPVDKE